ncbi:MAG: hypothetical protein ABI840_12540 [bacterium]
MKTITNNSALIISDSMQNKISSTIKNALIESGITNIEFSSDEKSIESSSTLPNLIVADVTNQNSRVMFELGKAINLKKPILLLLSIENSGKLPPDLYNNLIVTYEPDNLESLKDKLKTMIERKIYSMH